MGVPWPLLILYPTIQPFQPVCIASPACAALVTSYTARCEQPTALSKGCWLIHVPGAVAAIKKVLSDIASDAAHIRSDVRQQPLAPGAGELDITSCQIFLRQARRYQDIGNAVKEHLGVIRVEGDTAPFHAIVLRIFVSVSFLNKMWRAPEGLTGLEVSAYEQAVIRLGRDMQLLAWKPAVWCHWVIAHSVKVAQLYQSFSMFSSIPTERRHVEFKLDIRHCFQGYKLSMVALTRRYVTHIHEMDCLDNGLRYWAVRRGDKKCKRVRHRRCRII